MTTIAFDLDGVLIPDCDPIPFLGGLDEFYNLTLFMRPLFVPTGEYSIITARNPEYRPVTWQWIRKYLGNGPTNLYHEICDETPAEYKARIITEKNIDIYVESDAGIVEYLIQNTDKDIIHFGSYVSNKLS